jgi:hypothetical protein
MVALVATPEPLGVSKIFCDPPCRYLYSDRGLG